MAASAGSEVLPLLVGWVVQTTLSFAIVVFDERRLDDARLERAWPTSTRAAAIVGIGPIALPIHFIRTRGGPGLRGWLGRATGLVLGVIALVTVAVVSTLVLEGVDLVIGATSAP